MLRVALAVAVVMTAAGAAWTAIRPPTPEPPAPAGPHGFRTAPAREGVPPEVWAIGDGANGSSTARRVADLVARADPQAVLYLGDVYERGAPQEFEENVRRPYRRLLRRMLPTPGNHEWPRHTEGYDRFWKSVTRMRTPPWYETRLAGWQLLSLNSEAPHGRRSAQVRWLRARTGGPSTCRIAFWHRPRFSAGKHGDQPDVQPLWEAVRGRAVLVLSGHDHDSQRLAPSGGTVQIVSGAGGRRRYRLDARDRRLAFADDDHHGAVRLTLHPRRAEVEFVSAQGRVLDRSSVGCRPA